MPLFVVITDADLNHGAAVTAEKVESAGFAWLIPYGGAFGATPPMVDKILDSNRPLETINRAPADCFRTYIFKPMSPSNKFYIWQGINPRYVFICGDMFAASALRASSPCAKQMARCSGPLTPINFAAADSF